MRALIIAIVFAGAVSAAPEYRSPIEKMTQRLQNTLRTTDHANIFVTMQGDTSDILNQVKTARIQNRAERLNLIHDLLSNFASKSQENLVRYLSSIGDVDFETLWITNQLYVRQAKPEIVEKLASFQEVKSIDEEDFAWLIEPTEIKNITKKENEFEWGILKIQAPEAWKEIGGNSGRGIRVATIDTGVRGTHEALRDNFMGEYGWYDPRTKEPFPTDTNGHGSHTTGTIAGRNGIGVAPSSTWMACRGCATSTCSQYDLSRCGQFIACPTLADGSKPDCSKAPHVVSNSWRGGRGATWFEPVINAWAVAGIIPEKNYKVNIVFKVFSIGNNGPNCNTANSPGDNPNVIGVGSTMESDAISSFSSVGPTIDGRMKPDISAPGSVVTSSYHLADNAYRALSGTSMACPHVAGVAALLLARDESLSLASVRQLLFGNTDKELAFSGRICNDLEDNVFPNHVFGNGRLNALKSVTAQSYLIK